MSRRSPSLRRWIVAWTAFFALNVVLSAAFCKTFRMAPQAADPGALAARIAFQTAYRAGAGAESWLCGPDVLAAPDPSAADDTDHPGHADHGDGAPVDGDCEFHLLSGLADTSAALILPPPPPVAAAPAALAHASPLTFVERQYPIRAPPVS